jgi:adenylate cyclase
VAPVDDERAAYLKATGASALGVLRRKLFTRAADMIRSDPEEAKMALEVGLIDQRWLEDPMNRPISSSTPGDILERYLERAVERRPSVLSSLGLSAVQMLTAHGSADAGEATWVTVVFTDLEGFTAFTDSHGDTSALNLINDHHKAAGPVVRRWRGRIVKHLGDGLLCTFPDSESGVRAAVELLGTAPPPLRLRAGLHVGEAIVSREDVVGHVVNVAARVTETAEGGQVMITAEAARLAGDVPGTRYGKPRARRLKGVSEKMDLCEVMAI